MPQVVLRHPAQPGLPIVLNLASGEKVAHLFREQGYTIDHDTTVIDAERERADTLARLAAESATRGAAFVAEFDDPAADAPAAAPSAPAEPVATEPDSPVSLDLNKDQE